MQTNVLVATKEDSLPLLVPSVFASHATEALIEEALLTPKPALVDKRSSGVHSDMDIDTMVASAKALYKTFESIATCCMQKPISVAMRENIAHIGRKGEEVMLSVTGGVNTHRGAIWSLGILIAAMASDPFDIAIASIVKRAASLARLEDKYSKNNNSHGYAVYKKYGILGAKSEAQNGFPHVVQYALPTLWHFRKQKQPEDVARVNALLAIMTNIMDTCVLFRAGKETLTKMHRFSYEILEAGGVTTPQGIKKFQYLETMLCKYKASPGGAADLLAAALFLDKFNVNQI